MITYNDLYEQIEKSKVIGRDVLKVFNELDVLNSVVSQAQLNELLLILRKRVADEGDIKFQGKDEVLTVESLDAYVEDTFDDYSVDMYKESI